MSDRAPRIPQRRAAPLQAAALASGPTADVGSPRQRQQRDHLAQLQSGAAPAPASTTATPAPAGGLPAHLRQGIESLSGLDLSGVRVHRNSSQPATLQALAYAQGQDIHLAPGQEQHLPHEAWHVVQQAQGRVQPTAQMRGGVAINDDGALEREADRMGARAAQLKTTQTEALRQTDAEGGVVQGRRGKTLQCKCKHCGWEGGHAANCTPQSRQQADQAREAAVKVQHDQSMDNRTRADQSHRQHGGDAKGREKMYARRNNKGF